VFVHCITTLDHHILFSTLLSLPFLPATEVVVLESIFIMTVILVTEKKEASGKYMPDVDSFSIGRKKTLFFNLRMTLFLVLLSLRKIFF